MARYPTGSFAWHKTRFIFFAFGLLLFVGCRQQVADHSDCKAQADAMAQVRTQAIDSLKVIIEAQQVMFVQLQEDFVKLKDLMQVSPKRKVEIPEKRAEGDPTIVPRK